MVHPLAVLVVLTPIQLILPIQKVIKSIIGLTGAMVKIVDGKDPTIQDKLQANHTAGLVKEHLQ